MKKITAPRRWLCLLAICVIAQLYSCQSHINFNLTKEGNHKNPNSSDSTKFQSPDSIKFNNLDSIKSFSLIYNPKANAAITVILSNGSEYTADRLNASQLSSIIVLLNSKGLQFDTKNKEFRLQGGGHE